MSARLRGTSSSLPRRGLTVLVAFLLAVLGLWGATLPASAVPPSLTVTSTTTAAAPAYSTTTLDGLSLNGSSGVSYQVIVATGVGTLSFPETNGLVLDFGNDWSGTASVSFTGSTEDVNAALAAVELVTGADAGKTAKVTITALLTAPGYVYDFTNGHFYQYVADQGISWTDAEAAAKTLGFLGQDGYLATITSATTNDLISSRLDGAENVWFGGHSVDTVDDLSIGAFGQPVQRTWEWADGPLAGNAFTYCDNVSPCDFVNDEGLYHSWNPGEPNSLSEPYAVTNWGGTVGKWNDLPDVVGSIISGYVVEYGDQAQGATSFPGVATASSDVDILAVPDAPTDVSATRGNESATVSFSEPADNGSPITGYTVTTSPGGVATACDGSPCEIDGLENGVEYSFTVTATSANGTGGVSDPSNAVVPATVPNPPTAVSATGGDESALVSFTAPEDNGGSVVTNYTVTSSDGQTAICPGSPCLVGGLTNGVSYTFTVTANNEIGSSDPSDPSSSTIVQTVPKAPTEVSATAYDASATVAWVPPTENGGANITGYLITSAPGGFTAYCSASPCVVGGLTNGTAYTFTVQAINILGPSERSEPSKAVTPITVPTGPVDLTVARADNSAELTFSAPADDGGSEITGYQVSTDGGTTWDDLETTGTSPITATVDGLSNGTEYTIAVRAVNKAGNGPATELSNVTPAAKPDQPTDATATRGDQQATITFTAPADNGSAITGYTVVVFPDDRTVTCDASPCVVTDLVNGTPYTFAVYATNDVGDSDLSDPTDAVTPATTPGAPDLQSVVSFDSAVLLSFTAPAATGGEPLLGYEVSLDGGDTWASLPFSDNAGNLSGLVSGLDNGTAYDVSVRAVNALGGGTPAETITSTPATTPSSPRSVTVKVTGGDATVSWKAPESDGGSPITEYAVVVAETYEICWPSLTSSCTFTDLTPGATYSFLVYAGNRADGRNGTGWSEPTLSDNVLITGVPGPPVGLSVTPGDRTLALSFISPYNDGGKEITSYQVTLDGGTSWQALKTTVSPNGLPKGIVKACGVSSDRKVQASGCGPQLAGTVAAVFNGATYSVGLRAVNSNGAGSSTADVEVTPLVWFSDQVSNTDRAAEIAVPKDPTKYKGPMKHTKAYYRSHEGSVAFPAPLLDSRQLQQPQSVLVKGSYFPAKKTTLSSAGKAEIKAMATSMTYVSGVTCEGYAGYGGNRSHAAKFSKARADTVCTAIKKYAKTVTSGKTVGYGGDYPMVVGGTSSDRALNRRVIVLIRTSTPITG